VTSASRGPARSPGSARSNSGRPASGSGPIRVLIVAEIRLYREGLEEFLRRQESIAVAGTAASTDEALAGVAESDPHVVLLDQRLPDGPAVARRVLALAPDVKVVALAIEEVELDVIEWAEAGISGYVSREGSLVDLVATIHSVQSGELPCSPRIAATLLRRVAVLASHAAPPPVETHLTFRQKEIMRLIGSGLTNKEIAKALSIALPTVKNHVHTILAKMQVRRRAEVASMLGAAPAATKFFR